MSNFTDFESMIMEINNLRAANQFLQQQVTWMSQFVPPHHHSGYPAQEPVKSFAYVASSPTRKTFKTPPTKTVKISPNMKYKNMEDSFVISNEIIGLVLGKNWSVVKAISDAVRQEVRDMGCKHTFVNFSLGEKDEESNTTQVIIRTRCELAMQIAADRFSQRIEASQKYADENTK